MSEPLPLATTPELVFGLVAPIGVDLDLIIEVLSGLLGEMNYDAREFRLTHLMRDVPAGKPIAKSPYIQSIKDRIEYANEIRRHLGDHALAALAISAIRTFRAEEWGRKIADSPTANRAPVRVEGKSKEETPLPAQAYILRQFKRPEEINLLRSVYGRQFIVVSAYSPQEIRCRAVEQRERSSRGGLISDVEARNHANELISQDANETQDKHGQKVRDAFPLGDVFIDASSRRSCETTLRRFIHLLFGSNQITPTRDEYGMYMAKSASLRSSDLSRQVGAAIFRSSGEVITLGCNEVPKAGGGTYWSGDPGDSRDFVAGYDPNEQHKIELLVDVLDRLKKGSHLSEILQAVEDPYALGRKFLLDKSEHGLAESKIMDILEFSRVIHAEMSAICDAARNGVSVRGTTIYCTTFPCHICAKHIVASGVHRLVYLEPYPKSYASDLHRDSIEVESGSQGGKVSFEPFIGVSPLRYRDLFEKGRRKYSGTALEWSKGTRHPMIEVYFPSYFEAEWLVVGPLREKLEAARSAGKLVSQEALSDRASSS